MPRNSAYTLVVAILALGCGRRAEQPVAKSDDKGGFAVKDKGVDISVSKDSGQVTIKGKDGAVVSEQKMGGDLALPKEFPKDVPAYPGAKIEQNIVLGADNHTLIKFAPDPVQKVFAFYEDKLVANGWKIGSKVQEKDGGTITSHKGDLSCVLLMSSDRNGTLIQLTVVKQKQ